MAINGDDQVKQPTHPCDRGVCPSPIEMRLSNGLMQPPRITAADGHK